VLLAPPTTTEASPLVTLQIPPPIKVQSAVEEFIEPPTIVEKYCEETVLLLPPPIKKP
jgi:hypothetical protein